MPIGIQGKLNELNNFQRTDGSIQTQYNQIHSDYIKAKNQYKSSKVAYREAEQKLAEAENRFWSAPLLKKISVYKQVKIAKQNLQSKKQKYDIDKAQYKQKLNELRLLRSEIRDQYKVHREYVSFFGNVQKAQKLGIKLPKYIMDAYAQQKQEYLSHQYTVDKNGQKTYMFASDKVYNKDTKTLIMEKHRENLNNNIEGIKTRVKETFNKSSDGIEL